MMSRGTLSPEAMASQASRKVAEFGIRFDKFILDFQEIQEQSKADRLKIERLEKSAGLAPSPAASALPDMEKFRNEILAVVSTKLDDQQASLRRDFESTLSELRSEISALKTSLASHESAISKISSQGHHHPSIPPGAPLRTSPRTSPVPPVPSSAQIQLVVDGPTMSVSQQKPVLVASQPTISPGSVDSSEDLVISAAPTTGVPMTPKALSEDNWSSSLGKIQAVMDSVGKKKPSAKPVTEQLGVMQPQMEKEVSLDTSEQEELGEEGGSLKGRFQPIMGGRQMVDSLKLPPVTRKDNDEGDDDNHMSTVREEDISDEGGEDRQDGGKKKKKGFMRRMLGFSGSGHGDAAHAHGESAPRKSSEEEAQGEEEKPKKKKGGLGLMSSRQGDAQAQAESATPRKSREEEVMGEEEKPKKKKGGLGLMSSRQGDAQAQGESA
eukprot:CAMPEP_0184353794 /NCGR_PEP_ID=MMETSP1089-20130417/82566_1 /TAXON_ID=38269 ORGANISM="Gloeochaete wittrockiana, Strain SAG46.84" /NCGR_SAMPLE_ID=MMETSP1089 /ASSEMBLY_ACC=CAM_ASM_000445 /LENGTH=438 /DNA_ID=CAMNT_0026689423 /DNA_START=228 /DNA_END=1541 /DNA_ORIENTATION=-